MPITCCLSADSNRVGAAPSDNRVLIYQDVDRLLKTPTANGIYTQRCPVCVGQAAMVLGQKDFTTIDPTLKPTRTGLRNPTAVASDGVRLVVADTDSNRVLIWNTIPTQNNQPADVVVGQPDFTTSFAVESALGEIHERPARRVAAEWKAIRRRHAQ